MHVLKFASLLALSAAVGSVSAYAQEKAPEQPSATAAAPASAPQQPTAAAPAPEHPSPAAKAAEKAPEKPSPAAKPAAPEQPSPAVVAYAKEFVAKWSSDPKLIEAIKASTAKHNRFSYDDVTVRDSQWRVAKSGVEKEKRAAELLKELAPAKPIAEHIKEGEALIQASRGSDTSKFLTEQLEKAEPKGAITEVFVMDGWGWNVGQTGGTSDYYQADEGKWQKTFASADPNEIEVLEIVEEDGIRFANISLPIKENGNNVGAVTVGVNVNIVK